MNNRTAYILHAARGPILLITVGVLFALHQADILRFSLTWPILIIVVGVMKLLERTAPRPFAGTPPFAPPYPGQYPQQPPYPPPPPPDPGAGSYRASGPGAPYPGGNPK
ncbi:MAG TPA: hypothetical protein VH351_17790 [Bryobacteraceae bacterium]|nr:hypothetical protein [Bryobacteraceae bacterium]